MVWADGTNPANGNLLAQVVKVNMGNIVVIGSYAMRARSVERYENTISTDCDIIGRYDDVMRFIRSHANIRSVVPIADGKKIVARLDQTDNKYSYSVIEAEIAWSGSTAAELISIVEQDIDCTVRLNNIELLVPSVDMLYTIKMSHRFLKNSPHFYKTLRDIELLRKSHEVSIVETEWFARREKETYNYEHPKLNVAKGDFFKGDGVIYTYDHDSIHEAVKLGERPAYTYFLEGEVKVSKDKWDKLSNIIKIRAVLEECYVLALERAIIPFPDMNRNPRITFLMALEKVCTSITSGWFREYAYDNYVFAVQMYSGDYVTKFEEAIKLGKVRKHK